MKKIGLLSCSSGDDFARDRPLGLFDEIRYDNIDQTVFQELTSLECNGVLYELDKQYTHQEIIGGAGINYRFEESRAMMLLNHSTVHEFLSTPDCECLVYLQDERYYLLAESFKRKQGREEKLIKRILLCKRKATYPFSKGTRVIFPCQ